MKAELVINGESVDRFELLTPPRPGDFVMHNDERLPIEEVCHNLDRGRLQVFCTKAVAAPAETDAAVVVEGAETSPESTAAVTVEPSDAPQLVEVEQATEAAAKVAVEPEHHPLRRRNRRSE